jgi:tetratricopeptide (TPR) repeat protein
MKLKSLSTTPPGSLERPLEGRVKGLCLRARALEEAGEYEEAEAVLAEFWGGVGTEPRVEGLGELEAAELLLRAGAIARRISRPDVTAEVQESAKDLVSRGLRIFERLGLDERIAEAQSELAYCYWRKGEYDNAQVLLREAIPRLRETELRAEAILRLSVVEKSAGRTREALSILEDAAQLFESGASRALQGRFHLERATFLKNLGEAEGKEELTDAALIEYEAAGYYFELAGNRRNIGLVENQIGFLLLEKGHLPEAHGHLDRARRSFVALGDSFCVAQVNETRARAFLKEGSYDEAVRAASEAAGVLDKGDTRALLAEALTTLGTAHARGGDFVRARSSFRRAIETIELTGDAYPTALTMLTAAEELAGGGENEELIDLYARASTLLKGCEQPAVMKRLYQCADAVLRAVKENGLAPDSVHAIASMVSARVMDARRDIKWDGFSLNEMVQEIERAFVRRALRDTDGSVTKAALLIGYRYSESLNSKVKKLGLQEERLPLKTRRRSIIGRKFKKKNAG